MVQHVEGMCAYSKHALRFIGFQKSIYKIGEDDWTGEDNIKLKYLEVAGGVKRKS